jgi:hypothetical protein
VKPILAFLLIAVLFVAGCDTMNVQQYRIMGVATGSPDAAKVKSILQSVADKTGLRDKTSDSRVPDTLVLYEQTPQAFRVDIGARFYHDDTLVDVIGGFGPTPPAFKQAKRLLAPALSAEFGSRFRFHSHSCRYHHRHEDVV